MRFLCLAAKYAKESLRSWLMLLLVLLLAPAIIAVFYAAAGSQAERYRVAVVDGEAAASSAADRPHSGAALVDALRAYAAAAELDADFAPEPDLAAAKAALAKKDCDLIVAIPADFGRRMEEAAAGGAAKPALALWYDASSPRAMSLFGLVYSVSARHILAATGREMPFEIDEEFVSPARAELPSSAAYVPSFLVLAILNVLFLAATALMREVEQGTMRRIALSRATSLEVVAAIGVVQVFISLLSLSISLGTAWLFGYRMHSSPPAVLVVGGLSSLSMMAFATITACLCKTVRDVWIVGNFPYMICLFFSGFFPLPSAKLFELGGHPITFNSFIPLSHGIAALDKVLNEGVGLGGLGFELVAMTLLTAAYFTVGIGFFYRRHLRLR